MTRRKKPRFLKEFKDGSDWPYILWEPTDDVSFYPFDNDGCLLILRGWAVILGLMALVAGGLLIFFQILSMFGIVEPLW